MFSFVVAFPFVQTVTNIFGLKEWHCYFHPKWLFSMAHGGEVTVWVTSAAEINNFWNRDLSPQPEAHVAWVELLCHKHCQAEFKAKNMSFSFNRPIRLKKIAAQVTAAASGVTPKAAVAKRWSKPDFILPRAEFKFINWACIKLNQMNPSQAQFRVLNLFFYFYQA